MLLCPKVSLSIQTCTSATAGRNALPMRTSRPIWAAISTTTSPVRGTAATMGQATARKGSGSAPCAPRLSSPLPSCTCTSWGTWAWSRTSVISVAKLSAIQATYGHTSRSIQVRAQGFIGMPLWGQGRGWRSSSGQCGYFCLFFQYLLLGNHKIHITKLEKEWNWEFSALKSSIRSCRLSHQEFQWTDQILMWYTQPQNTQWGGIQVVFKLSLNSVACWGFELFLAKNNRSTGKLKNGIKHRSYHRASEVYTCVFVR